MTMRHTLSILLTAGLLTIGSAPLAGQETFKELAAVSDKDFNRMITRHLGTGPFDDGHGSVPQLKGREIKRIALISFYTFDRGQEKTSESGNYIYTSTTWTSTEGANYVSSRLADAAIPVVVEQFRKNGMEVLMPSEFLTDDTKIAAYKAFQPRISGLSKRFLTKDDNFLSQGAAKGFMTKPAWAPFDWETGDSFGELAAALGVDAVMVIANEVFSDGDKISFTKLGLHLYGPNPIARIEGKKYPGKFGAAYWEGHLYEGEDLVLKKPVTFIITKGKKAGEFFDGYEAVAGRLAGNVVSWVEQRKLGKVK